MATDQSPPRTRLIVTLTIVTVLALGILKPIFDSYYTDMFETEAKAKLAAPEEMRKQREEEQLKLGGIDKAMADLARGRAQEGERPALIAPQQSIDTAAVLGWSRLAPDGGVAPKFEAAPGAMLPAMNTPAGTDASAPVTPAPHASTPAGDAAP